MFIINLEYKKSLQDTDTHLEAHQQFLNNYYEKGIFICSGPKKPRTGGIILANCADKKILKALLKEDPFYQHAIANYDIIEFKPNRIELDNLDDII